MNVTDYLKASGINTNRLSQRAEVAYSTLHRHVHGGHPLGLKVAKQLEAWSRRVAAEAVQRGEEPVGVMLAAEILGLTTAPAAQAATGTDG
jgi:hypothetical protein